MQIETLAHLITSSSSEQIWIFRSRPWPSWSRTWASCSTEENCAGNSAKFAGGSQETGCTSVPSSCAPHSTSHQWSPRPFAGESRECAASGFGSHSAGRHVASIILTSNNRHDFCHSPWLQNSLDLCHSQWFKLYPVCKKQQHFGFLTNLARTRFRTFALSLKPNFFKELHMARNISSRFPDTQDSWTAGSTWSCPLLFFSHSLFSRMYKACAVSSSPRHHMSKKNGFTLED